MPVSEGTNASSATIAGSVHDGYTTVAWLLPGPRTMGVSPNRSHR